MSFTITGADLLSWGFIAVKYLAVFATGWAVGIYQGRWRG